MTCHGVEVHRFQPAKTTCGQSGCHAEGDTKIVLDRMKDQTIRHCTACHQFTAPVPALATRDSAAGTRHPGRSTVLRVPRHEEGSPGFRSGKGPTRRQVRHLPQPAYAGDGSCGREDLHDGGVSRELARRAVPHRRDAPESGHGMPNVPHSARGEGRRERLHGLPQQRSVPDQAASAAALRHDQRASARERSTGRRVTSERSTDQCSNGQCSTASPTLLETVDAFVSRSRTSGPSADTPTPTSSDAVAPAVHDGVAVAPASLPPPASADTFAHTRHAKIACLVCHQTTSGSARLTFQPPRGCNICHHQQSQSTRCASCHQEQELGGAEEGDGHGGSPRSCACGPSGGFRPCTSCRAEVRRVSHRFGHTRAIAGRRPMQGLPYRPSRGRPRVFGMPHTRRSEGRARDTRGRAPALRRVPHGGNRRAADSQQNVLRHVPCGQSRGSLSAAGMQYLPFSH